jgi:FemAB-related protein (PEP-CTERM system-associated)
MTFHVSSESIDDARWDAYANRAAGSTLYHLYGWRLVIEQTFGHRTDYLCAVDDSSAVIGILPLVQLHSRMFGNMLVSLPFFNYGGICGESDEVRAALLAAAIGLATERRADFIEIRHEDNSQRWQEGLPTKTAKVSMRLELPTLADDLWKALGSKLRSQVQRPRKEGMTAIVGGEELLDDFYAVFSSNMRDLGTPVYPKRFFRNILRQFPGRTWIAGVYSGKRAVASGLLAGFKDRLEIPWASSLREFNRSSPNMLLYWSALEFACTQGYRIFDFGRSTPDEGTYRFKAQWGARPHPLYWYYWLPEGRQMPQVNPANPKYRAAIAVWQHLPVGLTRLIGPGIVKYIP